VSQPPTCSLCERPAKRKCTKCGNLFCDLHVRQGNPHFAFGRLVSGSSGYYCDDCWRFYERKSKKNAIVFWGIVIVLFMGWLGLVCSLICFK